MPNCTICGQPVTSGMVIDAECLKRAVILPCNVGDTIYMLVDEYKGKKVISTKTEECVVDNFIIGDLGTPMTECCSSENVWTLLDISDYGKTVFLTSEEAEKALVRQKEDNHNG